MLRKFFSYFWGMIIRPRATLDELALESSIRFAVLLVIVSLLITLVGLIFIPGLVHLLSKPWKGSGTFEQMVNTIVFSTGVPAILISSLLNDLLLGGVIPNLLTGHPYTFTASQTGEFGPLVQAAWWFYMIGIYILAKDIWTVALGALAIHRV